MTHRGEGALCAQCKPVAQPKKGRPSNSERGYGREWRKIRKEVLRSYGIPEQDMKLYAVDHNPPYSRDIQPDHRMYSLVPRLIAEHNSKTAREDTSRDERGRFKGRGA
jgi:hypothetical protein